MRDIGRLVIAYAFKAECFTLDLKIFMQWISSRSPQNTNPLLFHSVGRPHTNEHRLFRSCRGTYNSRGQWTVTRGPANVARFVGRDRQVPGRGVKHIEAQVTCSE